MKGLTFFYSFSKDPCFWEVGERIEGCGPIVWMLDKPSSASDLNCFVKASGRNGQEINIITEKCKVV